jgi:DNA invertase Pin-like site-specific DNA recombinase
MDIIAYLRCSSTSKADHEDSVDNQRLRINDWAVDHGHHVVAEYKDEGVSGTDGLDGRRDLPRALDALRDGTAHGLVVARLDRLARDLVVQEMLLAEIHRAGAEPMTTSAAEAQFLGDDPDDPSRKLIRVIVGAIHAYERDMITLRLRTGKARAREAGRYAGGFVPFGQRVVDGEIVTDATETAAITRMRDLRTSGASYRSVAALLTAEGYPVRSGGWHASMVYRALARAEG